MADVRWTRTAQEDLDEIWDYIARNSSDAADGLIDRIVSRVDSYANQPSIGTLATNIASSLPADVRFFYEGDYIVFYLPEDDEILVIRVLHGRRNIPQIFRDEPFPDDDENEI